MSKSRDIADSAATINYIDGLTSDAQTQLDSKVESLSDLGVTATSTELNYVGGVSSAIQTQIDGKEPADATIVKDADIGSTVQAYDSNLTSFVGTFTLPTSDGTADQVLTTNGSGTLAFADAGGGVWVYITSATASGATTIDLTGMDDTYDEYVIVGENFLASTSSNLRGYMYVSGSLDTTGPYNYTSIKASNGSFSNLSSSTSSSSFALASAAYFPTNTDGRSLNFQLNFYNARNSNYFTYYRGNGVALTTGYSNSILYTGLHQTKSSLMTGIRLYTTSGTMDGELFLYGIKRS